MIIVIFVCIIYYLVVDLLSFLFSIDGFELMRSSLSDNFECGFYPIISSSLRFKFNYWLILIHFIIFESELFLTLLFIFGLHSLFSFYYLIILLSFLFLELF